MQNFTSKQNLNAQKERAGRPKVNTGLVCLDTVSKLNGVNIDMKNVVKEYGINTVDLAAEELIRIAKNSGFKIKEKGAKLAEISDKYPMPAIIQLKDGTYAVILGIKKDENRVLILPPLAKYPTPVDINDIQNDIKSVFILSYKGLKTDVKFGFLWFFNEILKYKKIIFQVLLGSFVVQLFGLTAPLFTQVILDKVLVRRSVSTLNVLAIAFLIVVCFEFLLNLSRSYIFIHTANKIDAKLGSKLFKSLFRLYYTYFEQRQVGNIIARVRELDRIREFITDKSVSVIIDSFFSVVFISVMLIYSVKLTLVAIGFTLLIGTLYLLITPELRRRLEEKFQMGANSNSYLVEAVTGIQAVKSLSVEGSMFRRWEEKLGNYIKASFKLAITGNFAGSFSGLLQKLMTISLLYAGVLLVIENKLTVGQLIAFQMFAGQFSAPVLRLVNLWSEFQQTLLAVDRIGDILNSPAEAQNKNAVTLQNVRGDIKIENLSFRYNPDTPMVLDRINLEIKAGQRVGLAGRSGSGKSTLAKLIQRLYYATEGTVCIDNIDTRNMNPLWLRSQIGVVLQENYLFTGTIRENITLPCPNVPMETVIKAAQISGANEFISKFLKGYETEVAERGSSLSGGQKQRIAIARALISNPKILIFDEATSALDFESEKIIRENLGLISKGRTVIIIAHRLSTIKDCDFIACFDEGKIVETGTHDELLQKEGYYANLYRAQM